MSRAIRLFKKQGIDPIPAPTNFLAKGGRNQGSLGWLPSVNNILLTDRLLHEFLGTLKAEIF
jgi:uncharacterized SAM-binding protein YcdF (DUF218 family)